jgi:hypothetical protein
MMQNIEMFNEILSDLGYADDSKIYSQEDKKKNQIIYKCDSGLMSIYSYVILYQNKKSYVYLEFLDSIEKYPLEKTKSNIKDLCHNIKFDKKTRLGEVGWEVVYSKQPNEFTLEERKKIFFSFIKIAKDNLKGCFNISPFPGDILAARPQGPKINTGFTEESILLGKKQRISLGKRFGFGEVKSDGFQYAIYDQNLSLNPL